MGVGIFADQVDNAALVEDLGYGLRLVKDQLEDSVAIQNIVEKVAQKNSTYAQRVAHFNLMWRSQMAIQSPKEEATFWIEMLAQHGNLNHLQVQDYHLNWIQYFCIDVVLFLIFLICSLIAVFILICKKRWRIVKYKKE